MLFICALLQTKHMITTITKDEPLIKTLAAASTKLIAIQVHSIIHTTSSTGKKISNLLASQTLYCIYYFTLMFIPRLVVRCILDNEVHGSLIQNVPLSPESDEGREF